MSLRIATNIQSLSAQRNLGIIKDDQTRSFQRLSSGSRINNAGDDAAGLAISEQLKSQIRSSEQATRNAGDGISVIQTAEGGLNEVNNILIRLRELSIQASSDTIGDSERAFSDMEFQQLKGEVERIATSTNFNSRQLLSGDGSTLDFQVGISNIKENDRISYRPQDTSAKIDDLGIDNLGVLAKSDAQDNLAKIDGAIAQVNANRAMLGALQNRLQSTVNHLDIKSENLSSANSQIRDTDVAKETANLARANVLEASGVSVLAQANNSTNVALKLLR